MGAGRNNHNYYSIDASTPWREATTMSSDSGRASFALRLVTIGARWFGALRGHFKSLLRPRPRTAYACPKHRVNLRWRITWARPAALRDSTLALTAAVQADGAANPWISETDPRGCIHGLVKRTQAPIECNTTIFVWSPGPNR